MEKTTYFLVAAAIMVSGLIPGHHTKSVLKNSEDSSHDTVNTIISTGGSSDTEFFLPFFPDSICGYLDSVMARCGGDESCESQLQMVKRLCELTSPSSYKAEGILDGSRPIKSLTDYQNEALTKQSEPNPPPAFPTLSSCAEGLNVYVDLLKRTGTLIQALVEAFEKTKLPPVLGPPVVGPPVEGPPAEKTAILAAKRI